MNSSTGFPRPFIFWSCIFGLLTLASSPCLRGNTPPAVRIKFLEPTLQIEAGKTNIIPFLRIGSNDGPAAQPEGKITPPENAEIILAPKILDGQPIGYLRIKTLREGKATLRVGSSTLQLEILPASTPRVTLQPRIVTPVPGAAVWGEISVAAECFVPDGSQATAVLNLPDGTSVFPEPMDANEKGPGRHFVFLVDTTRMKTGENDLVVDMLLANQAPVASAPVRIRVVDPKVADLLTGECENTIDTPRSEKVGLGTPATRDDPTASNGRCVTNYGADPVWLTSVNIPETGDYQMIIVSRGNAALGAYPTMTLRADDEFKPMTNGRVADRVWRRTPVGLPILLTSGSHIVGLRFENDFSVRKVDRNLYLDRYEIAHVPPIAARPTGSEDSSLTPMMSDTTSEGSPTSTGFKLSFAEVFDGQSVAGPITLAGKCSLENPEGTLFPEVGLWLNGTQIASGSGPSLLFSLDPVLMQTGENSVKLRAQDVSGAWVESAVQRVRSTVKSTEPARKVDYFTSFDKGWDASMEKRHEKGNRNRVADSAAWYSDGESILRLPEDISGLRQVSLMAKGQNFQGPPIAEIALRVAGKDVSTLKTEIKGDWNEWQSGTLVFPAGPKELAIRFTNDKSDGGKNDRNFWLRWIRLAEPPSTLTTANTEKGTITFRYCPTKQSVGLSDAILADFSSPNGWTTADLLIDDSPQNLAIDLTKGFNPVLIPLLTRSLSEGSHRIKIVATDAAGKRAESEVREIRVSSNREQATGLYAKAVQMLDRLGFGPSTPDLINFLTKGPDQWLADSLADDPVERTLVQDLVDQRFSNQARTDNVVGSVLYESTVDPNPVRQRFVLWTENHFSTWLQKTGRQPKRIEHDAFARIGIAPFSDLLLTSATSPAMLVYLDQQRSFAGRLNENYAREIMELHTLGVKGGYTQTDVTSLANLLTGWSTSEEGDLVGSGGDLVGEFRYDPALNAGTPEMILGLEFPAAPPEHRFDRVQMALETLATYPSTGKFISRKLLEHYISDPAPAALVQKLGHVYARTGGNMKALMTTMVNSREFAAAPRRIATPLDFSLRVARACRLEDPGVLSDFLRRSGMGLFDHVSPDGYTQDDTNYVSSNTLMQRWRFGQRVENQLLSLIPKYWRNEKKLTPGQTQQMLDLAATRLLGTCLSDRSNQAAMELLAKSDPSGDARSRLIVNFLCQTPEAGLR